MALKNFKYGPFSFDSELDLPELRDFDGSGKLPISLRLGGVPDQLLNAVPLGPHRQFSPAEFLLDIPGTGRFYAKNGREIRVQPEGAVPVSDLAIYLLGSVFGALCHQNGLLPLHASAVVSGGSVTAFLGNSGAGKSSTVALLARRGYRIFADDICLLEPLGDGLAAAPLAGWLKLWRETFDQLGVEPEIENRTFTTDDKYRMYLGTQDTGPLPVTRFCFLERAPEGVEVATLEPVRTVEAISLLVAMIYPGYTPELPSEERRLFRQCAQALSEARAYRLVIPWGWNRVDAALDLIEQGLLELRS